jgi:hypothetical protein
MINILTQFYRIIEAKFKENKRLIETGVILLLTIITGIYINLFTNSPSMTNFFGINLNAVGELWFMLAFGLIAVISLLKASIALIIIGVIGIIVAFILYLVYRVYKFFLDLLNFSSNLSELFILMLFEFTIAIVVLFTHPTADLMNLNFLIRYLSAFLMLLLVLINSKMFVEEIKRRRQGKVYNPKLINILMDKKIRFAFWMVFLVLLGVSISWFLANKFGVMADEKYVEIIITTSVFLAGFGLIAMDKQDSKNNSWAVFLPNFKSIILWSMASIVFSFCYLIYSSSMLGDMFFKLAVGFLFFTMTLIILLVLYHDNKYLREIEKPKSSISH